MSSEGMPKAYEPAGAEAKWYPLWESRGYFQAEPDATRQPYTIVIPPPNVTGILTLGHVLNNTLQDILIRYQRMQGRNACWVPGTDHAGIATQARVEAMLRETEKLSRHDLGREAFLQRVWDWKNKYGGTIIRQLRHLGSSCDWRRERFTLDPGLSDAVQEVFIRLYEKGLIYKGNRIINWCPKSRTALSDEEVFYHNVKSHLWYFKYPLAQGGGHITVATTRPETMLGDTAVAVNPKDARYAALIGQEVLLPLTQRRIPIIADDWVKPEFGTGAVKVTPAHDPNDYEIGLRHKLPVLSVMADDGTMNQEAGENFVGMDRYECREAVVEKLQTLGLVDKITDYEHEVGYSERGHVPVEPRLSEQWFVRMQPLAEPALKAVAEGRIRFHPERWVKTYNHWMGNIRDWCISRQLWWGHRIPAWTCADCGELHVARSGPERCRKCASTALRQEEDVLDTWFSSWLWPFSVFDWPKDHPDLKYFYPTATLVTGPDIIFFWVARMIMAGLEFQGEVPFKDVYFTSIIRDDQGRKLSKSLGNSPDPLEVIATYGADALRYTVIYLAPIGTDIRYSNDKCELGRNFANKLWNAARFRQMQGPLSPRWQDLAGLDPASLRPDDRWLIARTERAVRELTTALDGFDFHGYAIALYEFVWNQFCDWFVESAKSAFQSGEPARQEPVLRVFDYAYGRILRLMHPVMPFVTEELAHQLGFVAEADSLMKATWPAPLGEAEEQRLGLTAELVAMVEEKFNLIRAGRNLRGNYNLPANKRIPYYIKPLSADFAALLRADLDSVRLLLTADSVTVDEAYEPDNSVPSAVGKHGLIYLPLANVIDVAAEVQRQGKHKQELEKLIQGIDAKLSNERFLAKAPEDVVARERQRRAEFLGKLEQVNALLANLK